MKRLFFTALALILSLMFTGCGVNSTTGERTDSGFDEQSISKESILLGTPFTENFALVKMNGNDIYGIDSKGKIKFQLDKEYHFTDDCIFGNGLVSINSLSNIDAGICDKQGNVYLAENFGGTSFNPGGWKDAIDSSFKDGFIFVYNSNDKSLGVLDTNFNWLVPMSGEFYKSYYDHSLHSVYYFDGNLVNCSDNTYLDLKSGITYDNLSNINRKHPFDFCKIYSSEGKGRVYDIITRADIQIIEKNDNTFWYCQNECWFEDGKALINDIEINNGISRPRFYLIDTNGNYIITPTVIQERNDGKSVGQATIYGDIIFVESSNNGSNTNFSDKFETYNMSGEKIGLLDLSEESANKNIMSTTARINDDIICINIAYSEKDDMQNTFKSYCSYYTTDFQKIF